MRNSKHSYHLLSSKNYKNFLMTKLSHNGGSDITNDELKQILKQDIPFFCINSYSQKIKNYGEDVLIENRISTQQHNFTSEHINFKTKENLSLIDTSFDLFKESISKKKNHFLNVEKNINTNFCTNALANELVLKYQNKNSTSLNVLVEHDNIRYDLCPTPLNFYNGLDGVVFYLLTTLSIKQDKRIKSFCKKVIRNNCLSITELKESTNNCSIFNHPYSTLPNILLYNKMFPNEKICSNYINIVLDYFSELLNSMKEDIDISFLNGCSGLVLFCLNNKNSLDKAKVDLILKKYLRIIDLNVNILKKSESWILSGVNTILFSILFRFKDSISITSHSILETYKRNFLLLFKNKEEYSKLFNSYSWSSGLISLLFISNSIFENSIQEGKILLKEFLKNLNSENYSLASGDCGKLLFLKHFNILNNNELNSAFKDNFSGTKSIEFMTDNLDFLYDGKLGIYFTFLSINNNNLTNVLFPDETFLKI